MNSKIQEIILSSKSKIYFKAKSDNKAPQGFVGAIVANIAELGYVLDNKLIKEMEKASGEELVAFYEELMNTIKVVLGYLPKYKPMYPNFPEQVAEAKYEELWLNAILHYFGDAVGIRITPDYEEKPRFPFCELSKARWIGLATDVDVDSMWMEIFESKMSPSFNDINNIKLFFQISDCVVMNYPKFNNKERMAVVLTECLKFSPDTFQVWAKANDNLKTATDVLRIVVQYFNGDVSLAKNTKFGKISRPMRRVILSILDGIPVNNLREDMKRHEGAWIRLGEKLHPGEYASKYGRVAKTFLDLRTGRIKTHNSRVETAILKKHWQDAIALLKERPGDFARRLNALLSNSDDKMAVLAGFREVSAKVSTPVLWQLYGYFKNREKLLTYNNRLFIPKGKVSTAIKAENNLVNIAKGYSTGIAQIAWEALYKNYSSKTPILEPGTKVWINPDCENLLIPTGNRSSSKALRQVGRGSRFKIGESKSTVRLFVYWKDIDSGKEAGYCNRVDLDLSAVMFDENWKSLGHCSWTQLRQGDGKSAKMVHSGDITSAPNGASEFLDINLNYLEPNVRYVAVNVYCYTGQKMNQLDVGFCGWMEREYAGSGEIYEPKSVVGKADLTADATSTCPMILDVKTREIIWCDMAFNLNDYTYGRCVENTVDSTIATADLISRMSVTRANLYEMFQLSLLAQHSALVTNKEDATFIIDEDGDISPYDLSKITSEWL